MNCQQFTSLITEVARGQILDAASRDGAMRHAESCQACAARLAQERSLTNALRTVALDMKDHHSGGAPDRLEAKLLAAFRDSHAPSNTTVTTAAPASLPASVTTRGPAWHRQTRRTALVATAIAASLVLLVLATLYRQFTQTAPPQVIATKDDPQSSGEGARVNPSPSSIPPSLASSDHSTRQLVRESPRIKPRHESERASFKLTRGATPRILRSRGVIDGGSAIIEASEGETAVNGAARPNEAERVTEFISLVAGAPASTPLEGGQLVRVQLPRAALASLGLPLNGERENESVRADVLLGNDGLARAIRFVR